MSPDTIEGGAQYDEEGNRTDAPELTEEEARTAGVDDAEQPDTESSPEDESTATEE